MVNFKPISYLVAILIFIVAQNAYAVGLSDVPNAHSGRYLPQSDSLTSAFIDGKASASMRLRYEEVDDKIPAASPIAGTDKAEQLTVRVAAGWTTGRFHGFYFRGEVEAGRPLGHDKALNLDDDFRVPPTPAGNRINAGHAIIPDNEFAEVNEAYVGWRSHAGGCPNSPDPCSGTTSVKVGRQEIIYDNHRWVGNIVWRNNFQTYDAFRIDNTSIKNLSLSYSYINKVKRTFGENSIFNEWKMNDAHLINVAYTFPDFGKLTAYSYNLDFDNNSRTPFEEGTGAAPPFVGPVIFDSETHGARWVGKYALGDSMDLLTEFEWANQDPSDDAIDALDDNDYTNLEVGLRFGGTRVDGLGLMPIGEPTFIVKAGVETLEGNGTNAVQTPLATIHAFQGWADKFVGAPGGTTTPVGGIEDTSASLTILGLFGSVIGKNKIVVAYHDYEADKTVNGVKDYGDELNLLWGKPNLFGKKNLLGLIKYADYEDGGDVVGGFDTEKVWLMLQYQYQ